MGKLAIWSVMLPLAMAAAGCGATVGPSTAPGAATDPVPASAGATNAASATGAIVTGTFTSGRMQVTLTGAQTGQLDLPSLSRAAGAPGPTGLGAGYEWYQEGDAVVAATIRFPGGPVTSGTTAYLPPGTGIQVEFGLLASAGDLFSSSNGECTITFEENDQTALRGSLTCHGIPGSTDPSKTLDATGTFEAHP